MIRVVHSGSQIQILTFYPSRIQGSKRHRIPDPDPQYIQNQSTNSVELMSGVLKSLNIRAQALSPFTQTYVL